MSTSNAEALIRRRKPIVLKAVENLDAFPKVPETCVETTSYGGTGWSGTTFLHYLVELDFPDFI
jgi:hypothetical protein